jgi:plastocyanin
MFRHNFTQMLLSGFFLLAIHSAADAAIVEVRLSDFKFSPNDITINAGDTVQFINDQGFHDVTSDDLSWGNNSAMAPWTFNRDFPTPGVFFVHCTVHSGPGGNIQTSMNAQITVLGAEPEPEIFQINPGLNGSWANFDTLGQGFFFDVLPDIPLFFFAWFTWETEQQAPSQHENPQSQSGGTGTKLQAIVGDDNHRWMTAQGSFEDNVATLDATLTTGGLFDNPQTVTNSAPGTQGTVILTFTDCRGGVAEYDFTAAGVSGSVPFRRLSDDNVALCETMDGIGDDPQ